MKRKNPVFVIKTKEPECVSPLEGIYINDSREHICIHQSGQVVTHRDVSDPNIINSLWRVALGANNPETSFRSFPFSEADMSVSFDEMINPKSEEARKLKKFVTALAQHPQVECAYSELSPSKITGHEKFVLEVPEYTLRLRSASIVNKNKAISAYCRLDYEMKANVAWYFGFDPRGLDEDGLLVEFLDAFLTTSDERVEEFLNKFTDKEVLKGNLEEIVTIKKAMLLSQSQGVPFEYVGGSYRFNKEYVGVDFEEIRTYFKSNPSDYKAVIAKLKDAISDDDIRKFLDTRNVTASGGVTHESSEPVKVKGGKKVSSASSVSSESPTVSDEDMPY